MARGAGKGFTCLPSSSIPHRFDGDRGEFAALWVSPGTNLPSVFYSNHQSTVGSNSYAIRKCRLLLPSYMKSAWGQSLADGAVDGLKANLHYRRRSVSMTRSILESSC